MTCLCEQVGVHAQTHLTIADLKLSALAVTWEAHLQSASVGKSPIDAAAYKLYGADCGWYSQPTVQPLEEHTMSSHTMQHSTNALAKPNATLAL